MNLPEIILIPIQSKRSISIGLNKSELKEFPEEQAILTPYLNKDETIYQVPYNRKSITLLFDLFHNKLWLNLKQVQKAILEQREARNNDLVDDQVHEYIKSPEILAFENRMNSRGLSENTKRSYLKLIELMLKYFKPHTGAELTHTMIEEYISEKISKKGLSRSYQRQLVSALKSFYRDRQDINIRLELLPRIQKERKLPKIFSVEEVKRMIERTPNLKHKTILMLMYGCGLRVGELLNLRINEIHSDRKTIEINGAKGFKDRTVPISEKMLGQLREYYKAYRPKEYMIESTGKGVPYTRSSINQFMKQSAKRAGINRRVHSHMLRHSFATHLLEAGISLRYIQEILGHKSSRMTEIYTHVSKEHIQNIPNPYDMLNL